MKPKSRAELAYLYNYTCTRTFTRHLKANHIQLEPYKAIYLKDQLQIYVVMGLPPMLDDEEKNKILPLLKAYCKQKDIPVPDWLSN